MICQMSQTRLFVQSKYLNLQVHKEEAHLLCSWLESLGPVQYIVCASSYHTLLIHDAIKAFPDAKVVGPGTKFNRGLSIAIYCGNLVIDKTTTWSGCHAKFHSGIK